MSRESSDHGNNTKILLCGFTQSIYIKEYIGYVLNDPNMEVYLLDNGNASEEYYDYYSSKGVRLVYVPFETPLLGRIPKVRAIWYSHRIRKAIKDNGPYDVIHLHFIEPIKFRYIRPVMNNRTRLIASFWGSDIYRNSHEKLRMNWKNLSTCDVITLSGERMLSTFHNIFGNQFDDKIHLTFFGISTFHEIDRLLITQNRDQCKINLGIDPSTRVISIGYNRIEAQQHDKVLTAMKSIPDSILSKITILIPFTYGECSEEYWERIQGLLKELPCSFKIVEDFQSKEQIAVMRVAADVYINAQTTDAFSASVQEYLYSGAVLFNPVWIKYQELDTWDIRYLEYENFDELVSTLIKTLEIGLPDMRSNGQILKEKTSWHAVRNGWLEAMGDKVDRKRSKPDI